MCLYTGKKKISTKLRPGVHVFPGGRVILLLTQIMAIMELVEMELCQHQRRGAANKPRWQQHACKAGRHMCSRTIEREAIILLKIVHENGAVW